MAGIVLTGCESVIGVNLPEHTPRLSATSFFNPDSTWQVYVSNTVPYSASMPPPAIQNAQVLIMADGQVVDSLMNHPFIGEGFYQSTTGNKPAPQKNYTLHIKAPGYEDIEGQDLIPVQVPLENWTSRQTVNNVGLPQLNLSLSFTDPSATRNFYGITITTYIEDNYNDSTTFGYSFPASFTSQDPAINGAIPIGATEEYYTNATFDDDLFSGKTYTLDLEVEIPFLQDRRPDDFSSSGKLMLSACLQSISEDLYRYWRTSELQRLAIGDYFAEPVQVHSNISSRVGVFGGYQQHCEIVSEISF